MSKKPKSVKNTKKGNLTRGCFRKCAVGHSHTVAKDKTSEIYAAGLVSGITYGYNKPPASKK